MRGSPGNTIYDTGTGSRGIGSDVTGSKKNGSRKTWKRKSKNRKWGKGKSKTGSQELVLERKVFLGSKVLNYGVIVARRGLSAQR